MWPKDRVSSAPVRPRLPKVPLRGKSGLPLLKKSQSYAKEERRDFPLARHLDPASPHQRLDLAYFQNSKIEGWTWIQMGFGLLVF